MNPIDIAILTISFLLFISVLLSKVSGRFSMPSVLLFLVIGMLAGSEGPGGIYFDHFFTAQAISIIALVMILFDGGLGTDWQKVRPVVWKGLSLATLGVALTAVCFACVAKYILNFSWLEAMLLGSIVSSTDAAAVFSILRSQNVSLRGDTQPLLELESGSNDPMAVFLTIGFISLISQADQSILSLIPMFAKQFLLGAAFGYIGGKLMVAIINRIRLSYEGLYPVLTISFVLLLYSTTTVLGGSGFLAVYLAGLILGNSDFIHQNSLTRFHDGVAWLMQVVMFLTLGLLVFPSHLLPVANSALILAFSLVMVARPLGTFVALSLSDLQLREKLMISWTGLRGATPIVLAIFPLMAGLKQAELMFNVVFFVVLISVLIQGPSISFVARWLKVLDPKPPHPKPALEFSSGELGRSRLKEIEVKETSPMIGKEVVDLGLPQDTLIALITRNGAYVVPRGHTKIEVNDRLLVLAEKDSMIEIQKISQSN